MAVIDLQQHCEARAEAAWHAYVAAKRRAEKTLTFQDGLAASRAWMAFLVIAIPNPAERREVLHDRTS